MYPRELLTPRYSLWRHVKGGLYVATGVSECSTNGREGEEVVEYWSLLYGAKRHRALSQFLDGRFVPVAPALDTTAVAESLVKAEPFGARGMVTFGDGADGHTLVFDTPAEAEGVALALRKMVATAVGLALTLKPDPRPAASAGDPNFARDFAFDTHYRDRPARIDPRPVGPYDRPPYEPGSGPPRPSDCPDEGDRPDP